ncbi:MAG: 4-hydroxy-3-methylbut-2-enyl diphosphate reductase [Candidatus Eremiobacterota bacterium]
MKNIQIIKASSMGFCFGVARAVRMTEEALKHGKGVFILGHLIHNPQEVKRLTDMGAIVVENLDEITEGTLIIRSHGISPGEYNRALSMGLNIIDATCPYVRKVQSLADKLYKEGYRVIITGEKDHPEVRGILGYAPEAVVVSDISELEKIHTGRHTALLSQTTQKREFFLAVASYLIDKTFELRSFNTICSATEERQKSACELAEKVDVMIVTGGKNSANTNKLFTMCSNKGITAYHVETDNEIKEEWFFNNVKVGITAGASTPEWLIDKVIDKIVKGEE